MKDKNMLRTLALTVALSLAAAFGANYSRAVIIEGFTESGQFRSVLVSEDGRMLIAASTGVAQAVFFTSSQPVTSFQGTNPWTVQFNSTQAVNSFQGTDPWTTQFVSSQAVNAFQGTDPWTTQFTSSQAVNSFQGTSPWLVQEVNPGISGVSTAATLSNTNFTVNTVAVEVLPADATRKSSLVCNDSTLSAFMGFTSGVTSANGKLLPSGACFSPDNPVAYIGVLWINTTASVKIGVIEITP